MVYLIGYAETAERPVAVWRGESGIYYVTDPDPPMMADGETPVGLRPVPYAIYAAAEGNVSQRHAVNWRTP